MSKEAQSEAPSVNDQIFKILTELIEITGGTLGYGRFRKEAVAKINRLLVEARIDEVNKITPRKIRSYPSFIGNVKRSAFYEADIAQYRRSRIKELSNNLNKGDGNE